MKIKELDGLLERYDRRIKNLLNYKKDETITQEEKTYIDIQIALTQSFLMDLDYLQIKLEEKEGDNEWR